MYRYDIMPHARKIQHNESCRYCLARNSVHSDSYDQSGICEIAATSHANHRAEDINKVSLETIITEADQECRNLTDQIRTGFPTSREQLPPELRSY